MIVTEALIAQVKRFEGFSAKAYGDFKQWSIGYGTRAASVDEVIDRAEAERRLRSELTKAAGSVQAFAPNAPLGVQQALTDLTFNAGDAWHQLELGALVKAGNWSEAGQHLLQYNRAGGIVRQNLVDRRHAELTWFTRPLLDQPAGGTMSNVQEGAAVAEQVISTIAKVEPWIVDILPIVVPQAGPAIKLIEGFAPMILTFAARALGDIAKGNNNDLPAAMIELFQHLTPGQPNSPILTGASSSVGAAQGG